MVPLAIAAASVAILEPTGDPHNQVLVRAALAFGWVQPPVFDRAAQDAARRRVADKVAEIERALDRTPLDLAALGCLYRDLDRLKAASTGEGRLAPTNLLWR